MRAEVNGQISGATTGYHADAVFRLINGEVWKQSQYVYQYQYAYQPMARLFRHGGQQMLEISGMGQAVPVVPVHIAVEGSIISDFSGFGGETQFEFQNGQIWEAAEYKYQYHYAHRPNAMIVSGPGGYSLHVEGMSASLRVRRIR